MVEKSDLPDRKVIAANVVWLSLASIISQGFFAITLLITARSLGPAAFGQYSACIALARLTSIAFNLGMDTWLLREGRVNEESAGITITGVLLAKVALGTAWFVVLMIVSRLLDPRTYPSLVLYVSAIVTWIEALLSTIGQSFNILLKNNLSLWLAAISSSGLFISALGLVSLSWNNPLLFLLARLLVGLTVTGIGLAWLTKILPLRWFNYCYVPRVLGQSLPFAISDALVIIYTQADITLVALLLDSQSAGLYSSASGILRAAFVVPSAVYSVMTPVISQMVSQNKLAALVKTARRIYIWLFATGLALWVGMLVVGPPFVRLILREKFSLAGNVLAVLSVILLLKSCSYASAAMIIATNQQNWRVVVQGGVAFINIGLNLFVIPAYGILGAAWAYVVSEALLLVGYMIIATRGYRALLLSKA